MGAPYLLPAVNQNEPQYALPDAAYPPQFVACRHARRAHFGRHAQRTASGECIEARRMCPHARCGNSINFSFLE